jgi:hypothetical protein
MKRPDIKKSNVRQMLKMMIVRVPLTADFDALPDDTQKSLMSADIKLIGLLGGTTVYSGKVLVLILTKLSKKEITALFSEHGLKWTVLATEGKKVSQTQILKFMAADVVQKISTDKNGSELITDTSTPVSDVTGRLQVVSGHSWIY